MNSTYNHEKTVQLIAYFLQALEGREYYIKLIKLAYLADRESFKRRGVSITGDRYLSMKLGLLGDNLYSCFRSNFLNDEDLWNEYIRNSTRYEVELVKDPDLDYLTSEEIAMADKVLAEFSSMDRFELAEYTHRFREYREVEEGEGCKHVWPADILNAIVSELPPPTEQERKAYQDNIAPEVWAIL